MFDKALIPAQNPQHKQHLQNLYAHVAIHGDIRSLVDEKFDKVLTNNKKRITQAVTVSAYFDQLWKQADLKEKHKDYAIKKLEAIQKTKKDQILKGEQIIAKAPANLEVLNSIFQMTPFEQFNFTEKLKNIKKRQHLDIESDLFAQHPVDLDVLFAVNRPPKSARSYNRLSNVHYTAGLIDVGETDKVKTHKAEEFVKKIKDDKKEFSKKIKKIEKELDARELEELERYQKQKQEEEEQRYKEKKQRLENHIKELKTRSEMRLKESTKFEEEYFNHIGKKPMFKEMEKSFKRGYAIPELEERKRKLQEIRALHKPITKEEIQEHELKVKKLAEDRSLERKEHAQTSKWNYEKPSYESKHHKTFAEELSRVRNQKENNMADLRQKKEKVIELLQDVKDNRLPKADPQKELEIATIIENLKKRKEGRFIEPKEEADQEQIDVKKLGGEYLKQAKEYIQKHKKETPKDGAVSPTKGIDTPRKGHNSSMLGSPTMASSPTVKKLDYLADLRKENKIQSSANQVDLIIKNKKLDGLEKKGLLESEIEKLEEKAKKREMVNKYYKNKKDDATRAHDNEEVDQIYLNAIKAKLELLSSS